MCRVFRLDTHAVWVFHSFFLLGAYKGGGASPARSMCAGALGTGACVARAPGTGLAGANNRRVRRAGAKSYGLP